jgi:hypothetical protein
MLEWFSSILRLGESVGSEAKHAYVSRRQQKRELLWDFVLEAIGQQNCLSPDAHETGTVSLATIDLRIRLLQQSESERANGCGVPPIGDPMRQQRIIHILGEMVRAGKLRRCGIADRWKF